MKLSEIASRVGAQLANFTEDVEIVGVAPIEEAASGHIAFVGSPREFAAAKNTLASAIIPVGPPSGFPIPALYGDHPYLIFARVLDLFFSPMQHEEGIHPTAVIHPSAKIGANASIGAYVVIEKDVEIGNHAVLLPHVVIYRGARIGNNFLAHAHAIVREYCRLGDNVILQNGAVIGGDAFCFTRSFKDHQTPWKKVLQPGPVVLGDNVEVQTNASVARSDKGETRVGSGAKIGALALVGHESVIDENALLCPQVGVGGGSRIGKNTLLLGQAGVVDGCVVGDDSIVSTRTGVIGDVAAGQRVSGFPAMDHGQWLRSSALFKRLPELARTWRDHVPAAGKK